LSSLSCLSDLLFPFRFINSASVMVAHST